MVNVTRAAALASILWVASLTSGVANAQTAGMATDPASAWTGVMALQPRQAIRVERRRASTVRGDVHEVRPEAITLSTPQGVATIARGEINTVAVASRSRDSLLNGALWGGLAGLAYGITVTAIIKGGGEGDEPRGGWVGIPLSATAVGTGAGALVDTLIRRDRWTVVYRASN